MKTLEEPSKDMKHAVTDPVCCMEVVPGKTKLVTIFDGHSYWFCSLECREAFEGHPQKYLDRRPSRRKGWLGRFLDRLGRANEKDGPRCCHRD